MSQTWEQWVANHFSLAQICHIIMIMANNNGDNNNND
jgi:hypothetical protein